MPRVVPSDVVGVIQRLFPKVVSEDSFHLGIDDAGALTAVLALVDQIPPELSPPQANDYHALIIGCSSLRGSRSFGAKNVGPL
jgi:hypothetical protein